MSARGWTHAVLLGLLFQQCPVAWADNLNSSGALPSAESVLSALRAAPSYRATESLLDADRAVQTQR